MVTKSVKADHLKEYNKNLTVSRTFIFTQSAGAPTSTTFVTNLECESNLVLLQKSGML